MNKICLVGNICNDLELKSTNSGKSVCSFNLAVRRPFAKDITDFITVVVWNKPAELVVKFCGKGSKIGVTGVMTQRKYQDKDGKDRIVYEVVSEDIEFLERKTINDKAEQTEGDANADGFVLMPDTDELPF